MTHNVLNNIFAPFFISIFSFLGQTILAREIDASDEHVSSGEWQESCLLQS